MTGLVRIEHPSDGWGLFRSGTRYGDSFIISDADCDMAIQDRHANFKTPYEEGFIIDIDEYCAYKSLKQMKKWLEDEWIEEVIGLGFRIYQIDVSECKEGLFQMIFRKENILSKNDITNIFIGS